MNELKFELNFGFQRIVSSKTFKWYIIYSNLTYFLLIRRADSLGPPYYEEEGKF